MRKPLVWFSLLLIALIITGLSGTPRRTVGMSARPITPTWGKVSGIYTFPYMVYCSDIRNLGKGPAWQGVTIGVTPLSELRQRLIDLGYKGENELPQTWTFRRSEQTPEDGPDVIVICEWGGAVSALNLLLPLFSPSSPYFVDLVAEYGKPDIVTWTANPATRLAFWFERGIAVEMSVIRDSLYFGQVDRIVYFSYQASTGYEVKWPYKWTNPNKTLESGLPFEQDPFDYSAMFATMTAQPSRTPASIFTVEPARTPTAARP